MRAGDSAFPAEGWIDFAVLMLSHWASAALQLLQEEAAPVEVRFMEGPFLVGVEPLSDTRWRAWFIEAGLRPCTRFEVEVPIDDFVESLVSSSARILDACRERGWWSSDTDELERVTEALRRRCRSEA